MIASTEQQVIGLLVVGALGQRHALQVGLDLPGNRRGDAAAQFFFQAEQVDQRRVVTLAPDLDAAVGIYQLHGDADLIG